MPAPGSKGSGSDPVPESRQKKSHVFALVVLIVWGIGTVAYIDIYPTLIYTTWENSIVRNGFGATPDGSGIPLNSLYTVTTLASPATQNNVAGANHDTLYTLGVLDLGKGAQVLHVPAMDGRYYNIEFVDTYGNPVANIGKRTTGTQAGDGSSPGRAGREPCRPACSRSPHRTIPCWSLAGCSCTGTATCRPRTTSRNRYGSRRWRRDNSRRWR